MLFCGLIIWPRGAHGGETQRIAETSLSRHDALHTRNGDSHLWRRFWLIPVACGFRPRSLRFRRCESLLRRTAEEREDTVHLRSTRAADLRQCTLSTCGHPAVLVSSATSRTADEYLNGNPRRTARLPGLLGDLGVGFSANSAVKALPPRTLRTHAENAEN